MIKRKFLGISELAEYLGISVNTIYFWINQRKIPYFKVGKFVKFDSEELQKWIRQKKASSITDRGEL